MFFDDIIGQQSAVNTFKRILESNRLSHAYIFAGPSGIGKFLFARTMAKILMCENNEKGNWLNKGCSKCRFCRLVDKNCHPNLRIIELEQGKQEININTVREIEKELLLMPFYKSYRVFIINEAERMSEEAANAFLKTLEEPVKNTIIILVTSNLTALLPTILSRCQIIRFYPLQQEQMNEYLIKHLKISSGQASFLTHLCRGSIGDAVRLHSQNMLSQRDSLITGMIEKDRGNMTNDVINYAKSNADDNDGIRQEIIWQLKIIGFFVRDVLCLHYGFADSKLFNRDKIAEIKKYQKSYNYQQVEKLIDKLLEAERYLRYNANVNLVVDNLFLA
ncbi:MAG: DNA polymerase III subunit delta' [Planctomycetota bacterium]